jgi:hypothetical protein
MVKATRLGKLIVGRGLISERLLIFRVRMTTVDAHAMRNPLHCVNSTHSRVRLVTGMEAHTVSDRIDLGLSQRMLRVVRDGYNLGLI